ncbi:DUF3078 domain-containing protein [Mangrovimonas spongiae]|uniref:DUF3078 domain-containing protein n=1 Tax=Mangrovimonas spongiae TaxID=2494697 RepID=A0A3R9MBC6_9FLAO|nr:DUF3078 domain-containing protein [Mangrovimonas spongiae]RSK41729.1 DUF3078 domain-containing protein [Mangrovimonas spongiae]
MKKSLLIICFITCYFITNAQDATVKADSLEGWKGSGKITLLVNQTAFANWQAGGDNNLGANASINYDLNYTKGAWIWDNKLLANYGISINEDDGKRKTDDRLEINSIAGRKMKNENWIFSFFMNFKTQFSDGYDYNDDFIGDNEDYRTSGPFKPAYWSFGPGFLWKKSDNLNVNLAPATSKFTFLTGEVFTINDDDSNNVFYESSDDVETYGVAPGRGILYEFGLNVRGYYKFNIMKNISMENIIMLYSNYLNKPLNTDIDYTMNMVMKINDIFSTNLTFQTIYDDDAFEGFQIREVFGLGIHVNL